MREVLVNGVQTKGWGSYFVNPSFEADALIEVPHLLWDTNSWDVGAKSFRDAYARGFLMAGAHRNANGFNTADVAHLDTSIFHHVHESWVGSSSATVRSGFDRGFFWRFEKGRLVSPLCLYFGHSIAARF